MSEATRMRERFLASMGLGSMIACSGGGPVEPQPRGILGELAAADATRALEPTAPTVDGGLDASLDAETSAPVSSVPATNLTNECEIPEHVQGAPVTCPSHANRFACGAISHVALDPAKTKRLRQKYPDACCYARFDANAICKNMPPNAGRPFRQAGATTVASSLPRGDWSISMQCPVNPERAAFWSRLGALEHASVAAFARLTLDLLAWSAPADLIADVQRAALDEVHHTQISYGLASGYAGVEVGPGPLSIGPLEPAPSLAALAVDTLQDGCLEETTASLDAASLARHADPLERTAFARIADDEERHAELAFRILAWALRVGGDEVAVALRQALAHCESRPSLAMREVVGPCTRALLAA